MCKGVWWLQPGPVSLLPLLTLLRVQGHPQLGTEHWKVLYGLPGTFSSPG